MKRHLWLSLKWGGLILAVGSIVVAVALSWLDAPRDMPTKQDSTVDDHTNVESPVLVERKDGAIIWQLRGEEASQQEDGTMLLSQAQLTLYTESGKEILIRGKEAQFDPLKRDVVFRHQVTVTHEQWLLESELMTYENGKDMLYVPGKFKITGDHVRARGKGMRAFRDSETIQVEHGVWIRDEDAILEKGVTP